MAYEHLQAAIGHTPTSAGLKDLILFYLIRAWQQTLQPPQTLFINISPGEKKQDQMWDGALYKDKTTKPKKKSVTIDESSMVKIDRPKATPKPSTVYFEDVYDENYHSNHPPPPAPSPPPFTPGTAVGPARRGNKSLDVFEFLDPTKTPDTAKPSEQMKMVGHAPSLFEEPEQMENGADLYAQHGFSYGSGPVPPSLYHHDSTKSMDFTTPANPRDRTRRQTSDYPPPIGIHRSDSMMSTGEKKRKRGQQLEVGAQNGHHDTPMTDASFTESARSPPRLLHSGLTGGLERMLRPLPAPEYSDYDSENDQNVEANEALLTMKKLRQARSNGGEAGLGISTNRKSSKLLSMFGGVSAVKPNPATKAITAGSVSGSTRRGSNESTPSRSTIQPKQKRHKADQLEAESKSTRKSSNNGSVVTSASANHDEKRSSRRLKEIEYQAKHQDEGSDSVRGSSKRTKRTNGEAAPSESQGDKSDDEGNAGRARAALFLSMITKGPESDRGYSVHKMLKRFHKLDNESVGTQDDDQSKSGRSKAGSRVEKDKKDKEEDEKELWRALRIRRTKSGEYRLFF
ncbi:hypothetical protein FQN57_002879 [Myotisia sp. PD_48]|nr:hypothetical protein FQN57_002879 [Myotisia sp. PD_48]